MNSDMVHVQHFELQANKPISFDLYVHLARNNKFLLYRKQGASLDESRLQKLKVLKYDNFFVRQDQYESFVGYVAECISDLISSSEKPESSIQLEKASSQLLKETLSAKSPAATQVMIENLNDITNQLVEKVFASSKLYGTKTFSRIFALAKQGSDFQKHPVNVTSFFMLLTMGIGYTSDKILSEVAIAGLLHDVGLAFLPTSIIDKAHKPYLMSPEEFAAYSEHPKVSIDLLKSRGIELGHLAKTIIEQHHENFCGGGFPLGVHGSMINELAQVLKFADDLDKIFMDRDMAEKDCRQELSRLLKEHEYQGTIQVSLLRRISKALS